LAGRRTRVKEGKKREWNSVKEWRREVSEAK